MRGRELQGGVPGPERGLVHPVRVVRGQQDIPARLPRLLSGRVPPLPHVRGGLLLPGVRGDARGRLHLVRGAPLPRQPRAGGVRGGERGGLRAVVGARVPPPRGHKVRQGQHGGDVVHRRRVPWGQGPAAPVPTARGVRANGQLQVGNRRRGARATPHGALEAVLLDRSPQVPQKRQGGGGGAPRREPRKGLGRDNDGDDQWRDPALPQRRHGGRGGGRQGPV
mmetsp:Transcript_32513/g.75759  ORF Transcript_32513/g.75759 Transcript_32513/m.75759 type:complete len:223 (+) Transcript_32513:2613-3281(+)